MTNEIIRELWRIKDAIAQENNNDIDSLVKRLRRRDRPRGQRVVNLQQEAVASASTETKGPKPSH